MSDVLTVIAAAAGALVAVAAAAAVVWRIAKPHVVNLIEEVNQTKGHAADASRQLHPNSGQSARDSIDSISVQLDKVVQERALDRVELAAIKDGVGFTGRLLDRMDRDVQKIDRRLDEHLAEVRRTLEEKT